MFLKREDTNRLFQSSVISDVIEVYTSALSGHGGQHHSLGGLRKFLQERLYVRLPSRKLGQAVEWDGGALLEGVCFRLKEQHMQGAWGKAST